MTGLSTFKFSKEKEEGIPRDTPTARGVNVDFLVVAGYGGNEYLRYVAVTTEDRGEVEER